MILSIHASICSCLQCRPNSAGGTEAACPDDVQGGVNNINATVLRGRQEGGGGRCVEYVRPLSASGE